MPAAGGPASGSVFAAAVVKNCSMFPYPSKNFQFFLPDPVYFCQEWIIITHKMKKTNEKSGIEEKNMTGKDAQIALDLAGITVNKNTIPFETRSPFQASGIRIGTPALTTRGMKETEMELVANLICEVLADINNNEKIEKVRKQVQELTLQFPLPY